MTTDADTDESEYSATVGARKVATCEGRFEGQQWSKTKFVQRAYVMEKVLVLCNEC